MNSKQILKEIKLIKKDRATAVDNVYKLQNTLIILFRDSYDEEVKKQIFPFVTTLDIYAELLEMNNDNLEHIKEEELALIEEEQYILTNIEKLKTDIFDLQNQLRDYKSELGANKQKKTNIGIMKKLIKL